MLLLDEEWLYVALILPHLVILSSLPLAAPAPCVLSSFRMSHFSPPPGSPYLASLASPSSLSICQSCLTLLYLPFPGPFITLNYFPAPSPSCFSLVA